jgi:polyisoprenyl-teichoic acid--peptidoglycan teichoic acid transferase
MMKRSRGLARKRVLLFILSLFGIVFLAAIILGAKYFPMLYQLLFQKEITLKQTDARVNILLLGIGGGKHDGPNLTDTIIFASIDPKNQKVTLVSVPRDLWVSDLGAKINTAYAFGENRKKGGGLVLTKAITEKVVGQDVDYGFRIDFNGFIKAVDMIGGIDVPVDRSFDDPEYPITGKENDLCDHTEEDLEMLATASSQLEAFPCRYEALHFDEGMQHMDGETALKFVRSRHATGAEGTDFARSKRQEKVITAFKDKLLSAQTLLNPVKLIQLYGVVKDSIDTDIKEEEFDDFFKLFQKMEKAKLQSIVLDYGDENTSQPGLLLNPPISDEFKGQWVIIPRVGNGNYREIHDHVSCVIERETCQITQTPVVD